MALHPQFRRAMTSTVTIAARTGSDKQNKPTYAPPLSFWAYVDFTPRSVAAADGTITRSESRVYMDPTTKDGTSTILPPLAAGAQITVNGKTPRIISIGYLNDEAGLHHIEILT